MLAPDEFGQPQPQEPVKVRAATYQNAVEQFVGNEILEMPTNAACAVRVYSPDTRRYIEYYFGQARIMGDISSTNIGQAADDR